MKRNIILSLIILFGVIIGSAFYLDRYNLKYKQNNTIITIRYEPSLEHDWVTFTNYAEMEKKFKNREDYDNFVKKMYKWIEE